VSDECRPRQVRRLCDHEGDEVCGIREGASRRAGVLQFHRRQDDVDCSFSDALVAKSARDSRRINTRNPNTNFFRDGRMYTWTAGTMQVGRRRCHRGEAVVVDAEFMTQHGCVSLGVPIGWEACETYVDSTKNVTDEHGHAVWGRARLERNVIMERSTRCAAASGNLLGRLCAAGWGGAYSRHSVGVLLPLRMTTWTSTP
jgi:hypothetical protein